ncbi:glycosyltransferase [Paenibacillus pinistramenti]|uniref:glycosyltransferase n=1 Tax=Paenibacillus pinistramenti TaxID=1768003 RepID=UPI00110876B4|nr:glycosyltransferase [Paenibacillus pinistramenti]
MKSYRCEWRGPLGLISGLGIASRAYVRALRRQGVPVSVRSGSLGVNRQAQGPAKKVLICHTLPYRVHAAAEKRRYDRVILNTVWETTRIPMRWKPHMNKFDAIFVPSRHNKEALRRSGVKVPVHIVPHGVDTRQYNPGNPKLRISGAQGRFVFVSVFGFQHRKNPETLLRAYWEEFSASDPVMLVIKTSGYAAYETEAWIKARIRHYKERLRLGRQTAPVKVIGRSLAPGQLRGLYTLGNAFVLPTRGEGVGLPFLEAMASGIPVIATGWGGHMDFLNSRNSFPVSYQLRNPAISMNSPHAIARSFRSLFAEKGQLWAEAELSSLKRQMRKAYENPGLCRSKGQQARQDALKQSWNRSGQIMNRVIRELL